MHRRGGLNDTNGNGEEREKMTMKTDNWPVIS